MTGKYPQALEELMELLRGLPGVGRRSAERMALSLFAWDGEKLEALSENLRTLKQRVRNAAISPATTRRTDFA